MLFQTLGVIEMMKLMVANVKLQRLVVSLPEQDGLSAETFQQEYLSRNILRGDILLDSYGDQIYDVSMSAEANNEKRTAGVSRIPKRNVPESIAREIKRFIAENGLRPGDQLPPSMALAKEMGVGYTTLREAIKTLETAGLVEACQGKGVFVKEVVPDLFVVNPVKLPLHVNKQTLLDMISVRSLLEREAVKLAAKHARKEHIEKLGRLLARMKQHLDDTEEFVEYNVQFHVALAQASCNEVLPHILVAITRLIALEEMTVIPRTPGSKQKGYEHHRLIYEAIAARDEGLAVERMNAHLAQVREDVTAAL